MNRVIFHVDMNAFFASVEQKSNPLLRGKPVLVVADSRRRSVVMTSSYEARAFGVKTGMNLYEARQLCPQALVVDGNSAKYMDSTAKIMEALESFTDRFEMTSCDEAYLDVTGSLKCFGTDARGLAERVKARIRGVTGLPCSVGVAPNKLLAKLGSDMHKPDGLTVIDSENVEDVMARTPAQDLCGIGRKLKVRLQELGIRTCKELGDADIGKLCHYFGFWAYHLKRMGQGRDDSPVRRPGEEADERSMGHSTTFPEDTSDMDVLRSYLLFLSEKVASRMRKRGLEGRSVSLVIRYKDFTTFSRERRGRAFTDDGFEIYQAALRILRSVELEQPVRLLGVTVSSLVPARWEEFLFEAMGRKKKVNRAADGINRKFGRSTVKPAGQILAERHGLLEPPIPPALAALRVYR